MIWGTCKHIITWSEQRRRCCRLTFLWCLLVLQFLLRRHQQLVIILEFEAHMSHYNEIDGFDLFQVEMSSSLWCWTWLGQWTFSCPHYPRDLWWVLQCMPCLCEVYSFIFKTKVRVQNFIHFYMQIEQQPPPHCTVSQAHAGLCNRTFWASPVRSNVGKWCFWKLQCTTT